ncbi:helix-turn-helix domain-containing protein [Spongisporangium articulatum]|uniref:Helix-turn-helix domain-containing protein n=1 Tax=Spongisporangium articulatum TaxID=3362603 RepID=A0ABW8AHU9_9ACTN
MSSLGERVSEYRARRGMSQRELATEVGRSESWVSQVERDVLQVERVPVLQALADALGVTVRDLRPDAAALPHTSSEHKVSDLEALRMVITGHPAPTLVLAPPRQLSADLDDLTRRVADAWTLTHASAFSEANAVLVELVPDLEAAWRQAKRGQRQQLARLLADAYQAASSAFARLEEADAAWVAADRAVTVAELGGDPLGALSGLFRMAHAFITLQRLDQAEHVAQTGIDALAETAESDTATPEQLSVYGALHLVRAIVYARAGQRAQAHDMLEAARRIGQRLGEDRNDYETEFGPTNVELHAIAVAADLGDAGQALDIAANVDPSALSAERQSRFYIDVARAHTQRRHTGEALNALLQAEAQAPEQTYTHVLARQLIRDLLALAGRRAPEELVELARRSAALP